jgi:glycosyltransferase involved in cell wall biosynthesis
MSTNKPKRTVAYVLKKFPVLSETFILNELLQLEAQGIPLHIFSLERPNDPRFHEDLPKLKTRISFVPDTMDFDKLWKYVRRAKQKNKKRYDRTLRYVLKCASPSLTWRFFQACYIAGQVKRFKVGHLHAHFATRPTSVAFLVSMLTGLPYSFTAHAMDIFKSHLSEKSLARKIRDARFVVTVSNYNRHRLQQVANGNSENIFRIFNGIDLDKFKPCNSVKKPPFTFLCVARFVEKKGHPVLIEACHLLREQGVPFECWLVGKGKQRTPIKNLIKEKKLKHNVKLLGPHSQNEVLQRYHEAHAYVLPCVVGSDGNRDGLPVSIVEALACGIPVITTPMTGNPEVVQTDRNGVLVPFNNPSTLADAMRRLMEDDGYYKRLKMNARASVQKKFDLEKTTGALAGLFEGSLS